MGLQTPLFQFIELCIFKHNIPMDKKTMAGLIDAYADAKASGNKILIQKMIQELEGALNIIFPDEPTSEPETPTEG
jgi:hypothetical protein